MFQDYKISYMRRHTKVREAQRLSFLRQSVAYVLSESARRIPHAAMITQYDVTPLVEYGRSAEERLAGDGARLAGDALFRRALHKNFSAFFIKVIAHSLYHVPSLNSFLDYTPWRNGGTLYIAEDINVSFTVHTKAGVIKPIVRNPHLKDLRAVAQEMRDLSRKARRTDPSELYRRAAWTYVKEGLRQCDVSGIGALWVWARSLLERSKPDPEFANVPENEKLQVEDMLGATVTVANIGMMLSGHQTVTAIIPPEIFMVGIGDLHLAPLVVDGQVVPRHVVTLAGTLDHRALDGGDAFPAANKMRDYINNPALIYEWKPGDPI